MSYNLYCRSKVYYQCHLVLGKMSVAWSIHDSRQEKLESHPARITGNFGTSGNFRISYELVTLQETDSDKPLCLSAIEKHYLAFLLPCGFIVICNMLKNVVTK